MVHIVGDGIFCGLGQCGRSCSGACCTDIDEYILPRVRSGAEEEEDEEEEDEAAVRHTYGRNGRRGVLPQHSLVGEKSAGSRL